MSVLLEHMNVSVMFEEFFYNKLKKILKKQSVISRQMERQKMKNSIISPQEQFFVPISQCLPPSSNENIFSSIGIHVLTIIKFCGFYTFHFLISILSSISYCA